MPSDLGRQLKVAVAHIHSLCVDAIDSVAQWNDRRLVNPHPC
jgi:hypothetical protein